MTERLSELAVQIPPITEVRRRLGESVALEVAHNWVTGRVGLVYFVTDPATGGRSVFKWVSQGELVAHRDLLPPAPVQVPAVSRWWRSEPDLPAALEMEYIPDLACPRPCYRFTPDSIPLTDPAWTGPRLEALFAQLGAMHAEHWDGRGLGTHQQHFERRDPCSDWQSWEEDMRKLYAVQHLPGASEWIDFWLGRERECQRVLDEAYSYPITWHWADAKWDHIGCRENGETVVLEYSPHLGPAGSDLYLMLFLPPGRQAALLNIYLRAARAVISDTVDHIRCLWLGLLRACYLHGPGQACLSLRGFADGGSSREDMAAWGKDAAATARVVQELEGNPNALPVGDSSTGRTETSDGGSP